MYVCACLNVGVDVCTRMLVLVAARLPLPALFVCLFVFLFWRQGLLLALDLPSRLS